MDYTKDTLNSTELAKFVENQTVRTNPFGENRVGERAYRRAERIAAALVLLTNHVPADEPLRIDVRAKASQLLESVLALRDEMRSANSEKVRALKSFVRELISLCRLLAVAGFVSFQNAGTVSDALDELTGFLAASQRSTLSESASFTREDFLDVREGAVRQSTRRIERVSDNSVMPSATAKDTNGQVLLSNKREKIMKETHKGHIKTSIHETRASSILEVLRVSGELGIRDIASNLPEFSEKMIQRELAQMIAVGRIKKAGSKRWSTYALASQ